MRTPVPPPRHRGRTPHCASGSMTITPAVPPGALIFARSAAKNSAIGFERGSAAMPGCQGVVTHPYLDQLRAESRARRLRLGIDQPEALRRVALPPLKPASKASPRGARSDLIAYLQTVFGEDLPPIVDARVLIRLQPIPADAIDANPLSPKSCLLARTAARMYGSRGAAFFKGLAFIDLADEHGDRRLERFIAGNATVAVISDFDARQADQFWFRGRAVSTKRTTHVGGEAPSRPQASSYAGGPRHCRAQCQSSGEKCRG